MARGLLRVMERIRPRPSVITDNDRDEWILGVIWLQSWYLGDGGRVGWAEEDGRVIVDIGNADDDGDITPLAALFHRARHLHQTEVNTLTTPSLMQLDR